MAVEDRLKNVTMTLLLSDGNKSNGAVKTLNVSLGTANPATYDDEKAAAIAKALMPVMNRELYAFQVNEKHYVSW